MIKNFLAALMCISFALGALAEEHTSENGQSHSIGIGGAVHRTWGFIYRHYFDSKIGITVNIGGWLNRGSGHLGTALGTSYTLAHHKFSSSALPESSIRVYGIVYLAGIYERPHRYEDVKGANLFDLGLGAGPGAEFFFTPNLAMHLELPWMTFMSFSKSGASFARSYPNFGGGWSYYF